jgi:hypothetical protein
MTAHPYNINDKWDSNAIHLSGRFGIEYGTNDMVFGKWGPCKQRSLNFIWSDKKTVSASS